MQQLRLVKLSYLITLVAGTAIMLIKALHAKSVLASAPVTFTFADLNSLQKPLGLINIILFTLLLTLSVWLFYLERRKIFIYLTNLVFVAFTLFNYVSLSKMYFSLGGVDGSKSGSYWLIVFIGMFYIVGAITITAIAFIAIRNLSRRSSDNNETKPNKKLSFK